MLPRQPLFISCAYSVCDGCPPLQATGPVLPNSAATPPAAIPPSVPKVCVCVLSVTYACTVTSLAAMENAAPAHFLFQELLRQ